MNLNSSVRIILRVQREASIAVFEGQAIIEFLKEYGTGPVLVGPQSEVLVNIEARTFRPLARARFTPEEEREFERLGQILLDGQSSIPPPAGIPHIELFISVEKPAYVRGVDKTAHFEVRVLDEEGNPVPDVVWGGEVGLEVTDQIGVYRGIIDISGEPSGVGERLLQAEDTTRGLIAKGFVVFIVTDLEVAPAPGAATPPEADGGSGDVELRVGVRGDGEVYVLPGGDCGPGNVSSAILAGAKSA